VADEDEIELNAQIESDITPCGELDLNQEWFTWLSESAEIPPSVAGVDPSINYQEGDGGSAVA
jgi:hypothetical protein